MKITAKNILLLLLTAVVCIPLAGQQKKTAYKTRKEVKYNKDTEGKNVMQISENKIIFIRDIPDGHKVTCLFGNVQRLDSLSASVCLAVFIEI